MQNVMLVVIAVLLALLVYEVSAIGNRIIKLLIAASDLNLESRRTEDLSGAGERSHHRED